MKTILATFAVIGLTASPALAACMGHETTAKAESKLEMAANMSAPAEAVAPDGIDPETTASIGAADEPAIILPRVETQE